MKLLVISPYSVFPPVAGGKIRILELSRGLSATGVQVTLLTPCHHTQKPSLYAGENITLRQMKYPFFWFYPLTGKPLPFGYLVSFHPGLSTILRPLFADHDIYQFEHCFLADLVDLIPRDKVISYNAQNVEYDYVRSECQGKLIESICARRVFRLENKLVKEASHIFACCDEDRERFLSLYDAPEASISLAPNGITPHVPGPRMNNDGKMFAKFPQLERFARHAIFSGSDVLHNRTAARSIIEHLAPALMDEYAFIIHGTCGRAFRNHKQPNVFIDPVAEGFDRYSTPQMLGLNPVIQGGGTNLKILYYLYKGLQVVSTPFGMRGYKDLIPYVTVAPIEDFVTALQDRTSLPKPDSEELEKRYAWKNIARDMKKTYETLTRSVRPGSLP